MDEGERRNLQNTSASAHVRFPQIPQLNKSFPHETTKAENEEGTDTSRTRTIIVTMATLRPLDSSPGVSEADTDSSGAESLVRGRSLAIIGTQHGTISNATMRRSAGPSSIEFNGDVMQNRLTSRDLSTEPLEIDHTIMEPYPLERIKSSVSEVLSRAVTYGSSIEVMGFRGHRDTFALLGLRPPPLHVPDLPLRFFQKLLPLIDFNTYLSIRLSCRCWSAAISHLCPPKLPPVYYLAAELLEQVYGYLSPVDYNAARHTCRAWMLTSLEPRLLGVMLKRGGWFAASKADLEWHHHFNTQKSNVSEEWLISKRLAIECSLLPSWTGNGLTTRSNVDFRSLQDKTNILSPKGTTGRGSLILTSQTDFTDLGKGCNGSGDQAGFVAHFTVSVCGRFVLVIDDCIIYVYGLQNRDPTHTPYGGLLEPLTSIVCPQRVLTVSMDTSSQRYAVAALLDGRMGLVCDLHDTFISRRLSSSAARANTLGLFNYRASIFSSRSSGERIITEQAFPDLQDSYITRPWLENRSDPDDGSPPLAGALSFSSSRLGSFPMSSIPIETGSRSLYRNLCSIDDPPLSVAICPQRRCVAFGCLAGIELHWVDALTGQDLNRWFPLSAPSDFLYFLPPRKGVDSAKKLRLISSATPSKQDGFRGRFFPLRRTPTSSIEENFELTSSPAQRTALRHGSDHYSAVPLSDGYHVIFTDSVTGRLCIGSDTTSGGSTKLSRKFIMMGPESPEVGEEGIAPSFYAVGGELRWGVRVVAGFGERIWLFCVPSDVFCEDDASLGERLWMDYMDVKDDPSGSTGSAWSLKLKGIEIGTVKDLVDLSVDSFPGSFVVWAFAGDGAAYTWEIDGGWEKRVRKRAVLRNGAVSDVEDADGDYIMLDAPPLSQVGGRTTSFDGASSLFRKEPGSSLFSACTGLNDHFVEGNQLRLTREDDEGYWSDKSTGQAGGNYAIHLPPLDGRWSDDLADWTTDYTGLDQDNPGSDILELSRLECEVL